MRIRGFFVAHAESRRLPRVTFRKLADSRARRMNRARVFHRFERRSHARASRGAASRVGGQAYRARQRPARHGGETESLRGSACDNQSTGRCRVSERQWTRLPSAMSPSKRARTRRAPTPDAKKAGLRCLREGPIYREARRMIKRLSLLAALFLLVGCADDPQSCKQAGGVWDGLTCSLR
jgi:hypothetical protein